MQESKMEQMKAAPPAKAQQGQETGVGKRVALGVFVVLSDICGIFSGVFKRFIHIY